MRPAPHRRATLIRETPEDERPRERLLAAGPGALSDVELVAVLLRSGYPGASALDLAEELLRDHGGGIAGLVGTSFPLLKRHGLGEAKASFLLAAVELARRLARTDLPKRRPMSRPEAVVKYLALRFTSRDQELMGALFIDVRNRLIGEREIYRGTINRPAAGAGRLDPPGASGRGRGDLPAGG
jgi:DNA repair protein RadC